MKKHYAPSRQGTTATELMVAATLLLSMFGLIVPMTVRAGRIWRDSRHYQIAMNELSNQFEYLSSLNEVERKTAIEQLRVSDQCRQSLVDAVLEARLSEEADGLRLTLSLDWDRGGTPQPVKLVGWLTSTVSDSPITQLETKSIEEHSNEAT
jgi:hypothetical protein